MCIRDRFQGSASEGGDSGNEVQYFEYQWDYDQRGFIAHLALQSVKDHRKAKRRERSPVEVIFSSGEDSSKPEELVMGYPHEVIQWAMDAATDREPIPPSYAPPTCQCHP
eukprot:TRINITY_DN4430_c0_g1_i1.p1 TRINITY_DN4430_c0_g1~~TRINITY_DN4430_c0_g1_i1.p1  ORF type:complete len:110 (-),score=27.36 TRINITY_DN4430_c0_g1_i1:215-544(-)